MDLRFILNSPLTYIAYQKLVGGIYMRDESLRVLGVEADMRVLDIGCGPAYYLPDMPEVDYHGFDTDQRYIDHARSRFGDRGTFYCEIFASERANSLGKFDRVMLLGLLHHLDDEQCRELLTLVARVLKPGGECVALDTVTHPAQNVFEHHLALGDRGEYVRTPEAFAALGRQSFQYVDGTLCKKWWVPSVHWLMTLSGPNTEGKR